ncbi:MULTISPECIES: hypothetical protein [unclassified Bradyrhizobium]|uniref:hypothetical protein n=1 Tax=unclassified Bradyrhizobium TaxID=2631580 RepID=UPI0033938BC1
MGTQIVRVSSCFEPDEILELTAKRERHLFLRRAVWRLTVAAEGAGCPAPGLKTILHGGRAM